VRGEGEKTGREAAGERNRGTQEGRGGTGGAPSRGEGGQDGEEK